MLAVLGVLAAAAIVGAVLVAPRSGEGPAPATGTATSVPSITAAPAGRATATASPSVPSSPPPPGGGAGSPVAVVTPPAPEEVATDAPPTSGDTALQAVLTAVSWDAGRAAVRAAGYVSGAVEDGGTCTLTLTSGATVLTATSEGLADASTTSCGQIRVTDPRLTAGTWQAVLGYASGAGRATSDATAVVVP
ncbi:hypothetical protein [Geodermatophilus sp. SYSU D01036]